MNSLKKNKTPFNLYFLTVVIYTLPIMAIIGFNIEELLPCIALPIFLIWFGLVSAGNCIKPYTIIAIIATINELLNIFAFLAGVEIHWFLSIVSSTVIITAVGAVVFIFSINRLFKWDGDTMSDKTKKERYQAYQSRINCYCFMNFVLLFYGLVSSVVMFFKQRQLQWFYLWLLELLVTVVIMMSFMLLVCGKLLKSKICEG